MNQSDCRYIPVETHEIENINKLKDLMKLGGSENFSLFLQNIRNIHNNL